MVGSLAGGLLLGVTLPPFGFWFLAPIAYALLAAGVREGPRRSRLGGAALFSFTYFTIGLAWSLEFAGVAFIALLVAETLIVTTPFVLIPRSRAAALLVMPALVTLGEFVRYRFPLGGMPLAGVALGQTNGMLLAVARVGGDHAVVFVTAVLGVALFSIRRHPRAAVAALTGVALLAGVGVAVGVPKPTKQIRVAYVQGGGVRGLRAVENTVTDVFGNQVAAHSRLRNDVDLVVWPEDVIDTTGPLAKDPIRSEVGELARQANATLVAGVVEDEGATRFRNAAVAWNASGQIVDRVEKVHRVPFGEYVPARRIVEKIADVSAVPRDAIPGAGDGVLRTPVGRLGTLISYEVFFADRARAATAGGAQMLLVPTNASSFRGRQVPEQEVAAARLRAVETGRDLVQAAPTGHSVFVSADGSITALSRLGAAQTAVTKLQLRKGTTPYGQLGDFPIVAIMLLLVAVGAAVDRSSRIATSSPSGAGIDDSH